MQGYTHTSVAIHDALKILKIPIIELHISNIYNREDLDISLWLVKLQKVLFVDLVLKVIWCHYNEKIFKKWKLKRN